MSIRNDASFQVSLKLQSTSQPVSALAPGSYFDEAFYSSVAGVVMSGMSTYSVTRASKCSLPLRRSLGTQKFQY